MESGFLPPNLHFNEPNPYIPGLADGRLMVVTEKMPWPRGLVGINSFGFGGSNSHVLLQSNDIEPYEEELQQLKIPKILCYAGRTQEAVESVLEAAEKEVDNHYFWGLLSEQSNSPINLFPYRGFTLMKRDNDLEHLREVQVS